MQQVSGFFIGQRVNVSNIVTAEWQSERHMYNGYVYKINDKTGCVTVMVDDKTTFSSNYTFKTSGCFNLSGYKVTPVCDNKPTKQTSI